eukprot:394456_1
MKIKMLKNQKKNKLTFGVELLEHEGENDGTHNGKRYFSCLNENAGVFIKRDDFCKHHLAEVTKTEYEQTIKLKKGRGQRNNAQMYGNMFDNLWTERIDIITQSVVGQHKAGPREIGKIKGWKGYKYDDGTKEESKKKEEQAKQILLRKKQFIMQTLRSQKNYNAKKFDVTQDFIKGRINTISESYEVLSIFVGEAGLSKCNGQYIYSGSINIRYPVFKHANNKLNISIFPNENESKWEFIHNENVYYYSNIYNQLPPLSGWTSTQLGHVPVPDIAYFRSDLFVFAEYKFSNLQPSRSVLSSLGFGSKLKRIQLHSTFVAVKSISSPSEAKHHDIKPDDIFISANNVNLSTIESTDAVQNRINQLVRSKENSKQLKIKFARQKYIKGEIICKSSVKSRVNGIYSISHVKNSKNKILFINNNNNNLRIEETAKEKWELREFIKTENNYICHYRASIRSLLPPTKKWLPNSPSLNLEYKEVKLSVPPKPNIISIKPITNGLQLHFECFDSQRKPENGVYMEIWYQIQMKQYKYNTKAVISSKSYDNIKRSPFVAKNLIVGDHYEFTVRTCNNYAPTSSDSITIPMKLCLENDVLKIITCKGASTDLNGKYFIEGYQNGALLFANNTANCKIMKVSENQEHDEAIWALRELNIDQVDEKHTNEFIYTDHYKAKTFANNQMPPTSGWKPKLNLECTEIQLLSPKPRNLRIQAIPNAVEIHFECDESTRIPDECSHVRAWYEIEIREFTSHKHQDQIAKIYTTQSSPFIANNLTNYHNYRVIVRSCNYFSSIDSDISNPFTPLPLPSKPQITNITGKPNKLFIQFKCEKNKKFRTKFEIMVRPPINNKNQLYPMQNGKLLVDDDRKPVEIWHLTNGTEYKIFVIAVNNVGVTYSNPESVYPSNKPPKPIMTTIKSGNEALAVHFSCNGYNKPDIKAWFEIEINKSQSDEKTNEFIPPFRRHKRYYNSPIKIASLLNNKPYEIQVIAVTLSGKQKSGKKSAMPKGKKHKKSSAKKRKKGAIRVIDNVQECSSNQKITKCKFTMQTLNALKHCQSLNVQNNVLDQKCFAKFMSINHLPILNNYIHIINEHQDALSEIYDIIVSQFNFKPCELMHCVLMQRHNRNRTNLHETKQNSKNENDLQVSVWMDTMDSIHCYLFHLYDLGFRTKKVENDDDIKCNAIKFDKLKIVDTENNNKFSISWDINKNDNSTWSEGLYQYLRINAVDFPHIDKFRSFLVDEEYDTDAILEDIKEKIDSNVAKLSNNEAVFSLMRQYDHYNKLHKSSFITGFSFYYWNDYKREALYIKKKYSNIKEEILNNTLLSIDSLIFDAVLLKANDYINTDAIKNTRSDIPIIDNLNCGIRRGQPLLLSNLISIILYTDYSELSTKFSSTFRRIRAHESLSYIKERNREYWHWSKALRETVHFFGEDRWNGGKNNGLQGPFFSGLSIEMIMTEFDIKLCSPTSVSVQKEVATRFAGAKGIIITLNNDGDKWSKWVRCFNVSLISRYKEEDERLFIGSSYRMRLQTITIITTKQNYEIFFTALYYLDCMLNGSEMDATSPPKIKKKQKRILDKLIKHKLPTIDPDHEKNDYDEYVNKTFE